MTSQRLSGGKQRDWEQVRQNTDQPIITIITSTYNVAQDLHWTIDSITGQSYPYIQWIVADGASKDGTVDILKQHSDVIDYWFSEPDTGIYDAWNKALEHVQGDWVQFIGAGDELFESQTLEKAAVHLKEAYPTYDLVYGKVMHISEKGRAELYISGEPWERYKNKWSTYGRPEIPMHPAIYHHKILFKNNNFDAQLKISADSLFILKSLKNNNKILFIDLVVDKFVVGGVSDSFQSYLTIYKEMQHIRKEVGFTPPYHIQVKGKTKYVFKKNLIKFFGEKKSMSIIDSLRLLAGKNKVWTKERE